MNNTTHFNLKKPEYTDFADIQDINDNMDTIDGQLAAPTGDVRDATVSFSDSDLDSNINSFSDFLNKIVSGMKLAKFIRDFKAGMAYVLHKGSLINNGTTSVTGTYALDAAYGKTLKDYYDSLNSSFIPVATRVSGLNTPFWENEYNYSGSVTTSAAGSTVMEINLVTAGVYLVSAHYTASSDNTLYVTHTVAGKSESYSLYTYSTGGSFLFYADTDGYTLSLKAGGSTQTTWSRRWYSVMQLTKS